MKENRELINTEQIEPITINRLIDGITGFINGSKDDYAHTANRLLKSMVAHDLCLVTKRMLGDGSGVSIGDYFRLTNLGYCLCKYIKLYDDYVK